MNFTTSVAVRVLVAWMAMLSTAAAAPSFDNAKWIWQQGAGDAAGTWCFLKGFAFPAGQKPKKAHVIITCDNLWTLTVNGTQVGQSDSWTHPRIVEVGKHLVIEQNALAVRAVNTASGPAGLLLKLVVEFEDGKTFELVSDGSWIGTSSPESGWRENGFTAGKGWQPVAVAGAYGIAPWGKVTVGARRKVPIPIDYPREEAFAGAIFDDGIVFVSDALSLNSGGQKTYAQYIRGTRAYFEMDPMTPAAIGRKLWSLVPFRPDGAKTLLCDAGTGKLGSPSVSYDGGTIYFSLAKSGDAYFHIYAVSPDGSNLRQITDGPFHDYDPVELPDGRIAFSSTRIGSREEYHAKFASSLFTCWPDGTQILPLTYHIVADREPRVMADGSLVFVRMDNFLERAKVEVHLHQTRLDGTGGQVIIGPGRKGVRVDRDAAAEHGMGWLRKFGAGSPAPLPDGRVVAITQKGLVTSADPTGKPVGGGFLPYDLSALPDGRLLCTSLRRQQVLLFDLTDNSARRVVTATELALPDLHSVVHLGKRAKPHARPSMVDMAARSVDRTGYLYCQNVLNTQHTAVDMKRIKAVRIYEGRPFTLEPTKSIYEHIGTIGVELGTVPLAEDGSFYVEVPADRPLAMQAVDGEGRAVINELSWVYTRPREQRSCIGCHAPVTAAPPARASKALRSRPLKLLGQGAPHRFRANNGANGGIANLQLDRFREAAAINLYEVDRDGERLSHIQRLALLRDRAAVPTLTAALQDEQAEVRCAAAVALSACGNRAAVTPLMAALRDRNPTVVRAAANALEHLSGTRTGDTDWAAIEQRLIDQLASADPQEVHLALEALGHVGNDAGGQAIRDYLQANPDGELRILMAAMRALGHLKDRDAIPMLVTILNENLIKKGKGGHHEFGFGQKPIYLSATAAEALGWIGGAEAETAILEAFPKLNSFEDYVFRAAEHSWLKGVHSSVVHFRMLEALDRMASKGAGVIVGRILESLPADKDRGLLYELDSYEKLSARVIERSGRTDEAVAACLDVLGETNVAVTAHDPVLVSAVGKAPHAQGHIRRHSAQARAAQVVSIIAHAKHADRMLAQLKRYRAAPPSETRSWCCFMLTRALGRVGHSASAALFIDMLVHDPTETALGLNLPPQHLVYKGWRPFCRPAAAWSLGELKAKSAVPVLMAVLQDLDNAPSTREQVAIALGKIGDRESRERLKAIGADYPEITTRRAILRSVR
jgi:HEAT repeat protein